MSRKAAIILVCNVCQGMTGIAHCNVCGRPVCSSHRAGLGSLSEGYFCLEGSCGPFGFGGTPAPPAEASHVCERPMAALSTGRAYLIGLVFGLFLTGLGYCLAQAWHDL